MSNQHDPGSDGDEVAPLFKWVIRVIWLFATVLGVLFTWVQFSQIPFPPIENAEPTYIRRIALAIYYACWVAGTSVDANIQKEVYRRDPLHGSIPREAIAAVVGLFAAAALLLWASTSDERTSLALIPFLAIDIIGWRIILRRVGPIISDTADDYRRANQFYRLEQLEIVRSYITGRWHWVRFALMALIVFTANLFCFSPTARSAVSRALHDLLPMHSPGAISALLPVAALCLFIVLAETWIWVLRARNAIALRTIAALARRYTLRPHGA
jgi:hypothetical protein